MSENLNPRDPAENAPSPSSSPILLYSADQATNLPQSLITPLHLSFLEQITSSLAVGPSVSPQQKANIIALLKTLLDVFISPATNPTTIRSDAQNTNSSPLGSQPLLLPHGTSPSLSLSFVDALKNNLSSSSAALPNSPHGSAIPILREGDKAAISVSKKVAATCSNSFSHVVLGRFIGKRPSLEWVEETIKSSWKLSLP